MEHNLWGILWEMFPVRCHDFHWMRLQLLQQHHCLSWSASILANSFLLLAVPCCNSKNTVLNKLEHSRFYSRSVRNQVLQRCRFPQWCPIINAWLLSGGHVGTAKSPWWLHCRRKVARCEELRCEGAKEDVCLFLADMLPSQQTDSWKPVHRVWTKDPSQDLTHIYCYFRITTSLHTFRSSSSEATRKWLFNITAGHRYRHTHQNTYSPEI